MCFSCFSFRISFRQHAVFSRRCRPGSVVYLYRHHDSGLHRLRAFFLSWDCFRNRFIPAMFLYGWEWLISFFAPLLKRSAYSLSQSLVPVPLSEGPIAVAADRLRWISIPTADRDAWFVRRQQRIRRMEIRYGSD